MDFPLPELGEGVYEAELVEWKVQAGEEVHHGDTLLEVMTDKATMDVPSPFSGRVLQLMAEPGSQIKVGQVVLQFEPGNGQPASVKDAVAAVRRTEPAHPAARSYSPQNAPKIPASTIPASTMTDTGAELGERVRAAPSVRRMARALGIDLRHVPGSGRGGRILIDDLGTFAKSEPSASKAATESQSALDVGQAGTQQTLRGLRRKIAEQMVRSTRAIPHYSYIDECDVTELVRIRGEIRETLSQRGVKLTYLPFFIKAVVGGLQQVPIVNSTFDEESGNITLHRECHVGVAMAAAKGLVVPVIKNAQDKTLEEIAREIERLVQGVRSHQLSTEEFRGSTFSVTSVGNIGGLISTPIINHPEVGIMGIGKIQKRPVFGDDDQIQAAQMVYLSFSFDHRIVDGAVGAMFGNAVLERLQHPAKMLV